MSDATGVTAQTTVRFPDGETPQMTELSEQLAQLLAHDGLAHLVLYDGDTTRVALAATVPEPSGPSSRRTNDHPEFTLAPDSYDHERTGRQIYYLLEELQPDFTALRTGALIRTVLRVPSGAVLYYQVEPGCHLYAATASVHRLAELDASMAECANNLRLPGRYSPLNYGSWFDTESWTLLSEAAPGARVPGEAAPLPTADPVHVYRPDTDAPSSRAEDLLPEALDVQGLHYVAYHTSPVTAWVYDIFDHAVLHTFFRRRTPDQRRDRYARMSRLLPGVVERMNMSLSAILRGEIVQLILDVEQGAVYYHTLEDGSFLVGVTLDQTRVTAADHRLARLAKELSKPSGSVES
ncbi:hypothetical protein ACFV29_12035 [Streptomyces sp. NPDC059690]|uniref:hypothetical protein n=1 Tax=Streptomyces sp. NPDC059690 TaxID=3346907 RepID=UPI0036A52C9E